MSEIREVFFNGYCKNYDMARTAIGEFCRDKECFFLDRIDCDYGNCPHGENCEMMKQVFAFLDSLNEK